MQSFSLVFLLVYISILLALTFWKHFGEELDASFEKWPKRLYCLSLSMACLFALGASFNILIHFCGVTLGGLGVFLVSLLFASMLSWWNRHELARAPSFWSYKSLRPVLCLDGAINSQLGPVTRKSLLFISFLLLPVILLAFSYIYRVTLPIGHQDQFTQYLYESIQIASLGHLSIPDYYNLGQAFRSDSFASFFDALFIQAAGGWLVPILLRFFLIILSVAFCASIVQAKSKSFILSLIFVLLALSLPDLWAIGVSGKHDAYVMFLEIVVFATTSLAFVCRTPSACFSFVTLAFSLQIAAVASRLSSVALMLIVIPALAIALAKNSNKLPPSFNIYNFRSYLKLKSLCLAALAVMVLVSASVAVILNWTHLANPFYRLSPPGFLVSYFPSAEYMYNYENFKNNYSLRIELPPLISNMVTALYAAFGLEILRFGSRQLSSDAPFIGGVYQWVSMVGPKDLLVSVLCLSPAVFLPILYFRRFLNRTSGALVASLYVWMVLWTAGIPYTRVFLAGTFLLMVAGLSVYQIPSQLKREAHEGGRLRRLQLPAQLSLGIMAISIAYGCMFSFWAATHTLDLRSANGISFDRDKAVTRFLQMTSVDGVTLFGNKPLLIPSPSFRSDWKELLEEEPAVLHLLKGVPTYFSYLADRALIAERSVSKFIPTSYSDVKCYGYSRSSLYQIPCD